MLGYIIINGNHQKKIQLIFKIIIKRDPDKKNRDQIFTYHDEETGINYKYKQCKLMNKYNINHDDVTNFCLKMLNPKKSDVPKMINFNPNVSDDFGEKINVGITNILLDENKIICENGDEVKNNDIVEMRYEKDATK